MFNHRHEIENEAGMRSVDIREAKAKFAALIAAAERGEQTTVPRRGKPAAVLVPVVGVPRRRTANRTSFADLLLAFPGGIEFERDRLPLRSAFSHPIDLPAD
jgi:prevent-host-death family protein